jgi:GTP-binding protein Era
MITRCGYVALVGAPNVGKSTLLNHILNFKLSITSRKPQTTRHNLLGVDTRGSDQAIYVDTPGIHDNQHRQINRYMVREAMSVLTDVDLIVMLLDRDQWGDDEELIVRNLPEGKRVIAVINKVDLLKDKRKLLPLIEQLFGRSLFQDIVPVSALRQDGTEALRDLVFEHLPEGPHLFPADQVTDQSERFLVSEIVREKIMRRLGDELPHRCAVVIERYVEEGEKVDISADIIVERNGQKQIVIGKAGEKLKSIGIDARRDIEALINKKVMLRLWVKVRPGWTNSTADLQRLGYD